MPIWEGPARIMGASACRGSYNLGANTSSSGVALSRRGRIPAPFLELQKKSMLKRCYVVLRISVL